MDLKNLLEKLGLTDTESRLYLEALLFEHVSGSELAELTGIKRPTVYHALETLQEKGLVKTIGSSKIVRFKAEDPSQLKFLLEKKQFELENLEKQITKALPLFPGVESIGPNLPKIEYFKGRQGIEVLAEKSFRENKKGELLALIPSFEVATATFSKDYLKFYSEQKKSVQIITKSIWGDVPDDKYFHQHSDFFRTVRLAPEIMRGKYKSIILIWDNKVAVISLLPELFGFLVTSFDYSETMKIIWQTLWEISKNYDI